MDKQTTLSIMAAILRGGSLGQTKLPILTTEGAVMEAMDIYDATAEQLSELNTKGAFL